VLQNNHSVSSEDQNGDVEFPQELCKAVAKITDGFSFAYMQEAFLASLLQLAIGPEDNNYEEPISSPTVEFVKVQHDEKAADAHDEASDGDKDLDKYVLWRELKKQVNILREQIGNDDDSKRSSVPPPLNQQRMVIRGYQKAVPMHRTTPT
jgi:hypothetical protein